MKLPFFSFRCWLIKHLAGRDAIAINLKFTCHAKATLQQLHPEANGLYAHNVFQNLKFKK